MGAVVGKILLGNACGAVYTIPVVGHLFFCIHICLGYYQDAHSILIATRSCSSKRHVQILTFTGPDF